MDSSDYYQIINLTDPNNYCPHIQSVMNTSILCKVNADQQIVIVSFGINYYNECSSHFIEIPTNEVQESIFHGHSRQ